MIPKILHQIWIGPNKIPDHIKRYCEIASEKFHDYEYKFWTNDNIPHMPDLCVAQMARYEKRKQYALQADILRYYLLNEYGGIYLDADFICNKRFDVLIKKNFFCVNPNRNGFHVCNGVFACLPQNPILSNLLCELRNEPTHGPMLFTKYIAKFLKIPMRTSIINYLDKNDHEYVQCDGPENFFRKNTYCYHDALKSWLPRTRGQK